MKQINKIIKAAKNLSGPFKKTMKHTGVVVGGAALLGLISHVSGEALSRVSRKTMEHAKELWKHLRS